MWVVDRRSGSPFLSTADAVANEVGLYDFKSIDADKGRTIDTAWKGYEAKLPLALDALADEQKQLDGRTWLSTLVPFVAGLFVRGPSFSDEFANRLPASVTEAVTVSAADNATGARLIELQLLLAPVMTARWTVLHYPQDARLVTSDTALAGTSTSFVPPLGSTETGYAIPIDSCTILVVSVARRRPVLRWDGNQWMALIEHRLAPTSELPNLRRAIGAHARNSVFGPTRKAVVEASADIAAAPWQGPGLLGNVAEANVYSHIYDYFRLLSALPTPPCEAQEAVDTVQWSRVNGDEWTGPVVVELLPGEPRRGGVRVDGDCLVLDLARVDSRSARAWTFMELPAVRKNQDKIAGPDNWLDSLGGK